MDRPDPKADAVIALSTLLASLLRGGRHLPQATRRSRGHRVLLVRSSYDVQDCA